MIKNLAKYSAAASSGALLYHFIKNDNKQIIEDAQTINLDSIAKTSNIPKHIIPFSLVQKQNSTVEPIPQNNNQHAIQITGQLGYPSTVNIISKPNFIISYNKERRHPNWVMERIIKDQISITDAADRENANFFNESSVDEYFQSSNGDYKNSGFDRGHLAAAANHRHSQQNMNQTFTLANVCPQTPELNRGIWSKLEQYTRAMAQHNKAVYCISGPLYLPYLDTNQDKNKKFIKYQVIGNNNVAVPTHFFKVIAVQRNDNDLLDVKSFVFENSNDKKFVEGNQNLNEYLVPCDVIERATGLLITKNLKRGLINSVNKPIKGRN